MKKTHLLLGFLALIFIACGSGKEKSDEKSESNEPNNKIEEATVAKIGSEINMSIEKAGDIDWYKVEIGEQGYLQALVKGTPEDLNVQMRFAKYDEWGDEKEDFITGWNEMPATIQLLEKGTYYIMVAERWGEKFSNEEFTLKIDFIKEFDAYEPNIDALSAKVVAFETGYESAIFPLEDQDWFKVNVEAQGYLEVKAKDIDEEINLAVCFNQFDEYNENPVEVLKSKESVPQTIAVNEPGDYYIVLSERWDSKYSPELFNWVVNFIPEMDEFEPNNTELLAKKITGNETISLAIFPLEDIDMFKFVPKTVSVLNIKGKNFGDIDAAATIFKLNEDNKLEKLETIEIPGKYAIPEAGVEYFIGIKDKYDSNSSPELFELVFSY